jgi:drug/metabolite transporter (DMT)-like permease
MVWLLWMLFSVGYSKTCLPPLHFTDKCIGTGGQSIESRLQTKRAMSKGLLLMCAALYGSDYLCTKILQDHLSSQVILASRFTLAALPFVPYVSKKLREHKSIVGGIELGICNAAGFAATALSLKIAPLERVAVLSSLSLFMIPLFDCLLRDKPDIWLQFRGPLLAFIGVLMTEHENDNMQSFSVREVVLLCPPLFFGYSVWRGEHFAKREDFDSLLISGWNLISVAVVSCIWTIFTVDFSIIKWLSFRNKSMTNPLILFCMLYMSIIATAAVCIMEQFSLNYVTASEASIVYSLEPLFGTVTAWYFSNEKLQKSIFVASLFLILANLISDWDSRLERGSSRGHVILRSTSSIENLEEINHF